MSAGLVHRRSLREVAEDVERASGMRVEIIGGAIVMSPTPRGKHFGIVVRIRRQLEARLPDGLVVGEVVSVRAADDEEDYATPDLMVLPLEFEESDDWLVDPDAVAFVLEVVSASNASKDTTTMPVWYAQQGVSIFLLVDPRSCTWVLHTAPRGGEYRGTLRGTFGEPVPLPAPFGFSLDTGGFPAYEPTSRPRASTSA
jgi:Uma2 family endonuclease